MFQYGKNSHLRERLLGISKCEFSPTFSRNKNLEQHIRKKIYKPNVLRFWVEGSVISLCRSGWISTSNFVRTNKLSFKKMYK